MHNKDVSQSADELIFSCRNWDWDQQMQYGDKLTILQHIYSSIFYCPCILSAQIIHWDMKLKTQIVTFTTINLYTKLNISYRYLQLSVQV